MYREGGQEGYEHYRSMPDAESKSATCGSSNSTISSSVGSGIKLYKTSIIYISSWMCSVCLRMRCVCVAYALLMRW